MNPRPSRTGVIIVIPLLIVAALAVWTYATRTTNSEDKWPPAVKRVDYPSQADASLQPAMFYAPASAEAKPLLVALHTWNGGYDQADSIDYAEWCMKQGWAFIHPHFRGANNRPEAAGSPLVVADILSAVDYARGRTEIDQNRIYLIGESGGGHAALLLAGRAPQVWAGVSAWVPVTDLTRFHAESSTSKQRYAADIVAACGGKPEKDSPADLECRRRSPVTFLSRARAIAIDINAGIRDGHDRGGMVPIGHSLLAFNRLAAEPDRFSEAEIAELERSAQVPARLRFAGEDPLYGAHRVLLRRESGKARITLFDGGHERITAAGLAWLSALPARP